MHGPWVLSLSAGSLRVRPLVLFNTGVALSAGSSVRMGQESVRSLRVLRAELIIGVEDFFSMLIPIIISVNPAFY